MTGKKSTISPVKRQFKVHIVTTVTTRIKMELRKLENMLLNISATACVSFVKRETIAPAAV